MARLSQQKAPKGPSTLSRPSSAITDPRFASISTDPRYRLPSKKHTHVRLDKRFSRMLRDDDFSRKATVDRYGRKLPKGSGRKELERFYRVEDEEAESDPADDDEIVSRELKRVENYDPARQGGFDTSEEESSEDDEEEELGLDADEEAANLAGEETQEIPMGEISSRIALVNLDWDNVRAVDLMAVAESFAPPDGRILKVSIYPSEFGKERMGREELEGPPRELFSNVKRHVRTDDASPDSRNDAEDSDEDDRIRKSLQAEDAGEEFDSSRLRAYQLSRLRYYYAVLTCSSPSTAHALYSSMDGREYLTTANFFDMRFIPDDTSFDDDRPRDECDKVPEGYRPNEFVTEALTHSKVRLTWDADDQTRKEVQKRAFSRGEIEENDLQAYIGSDTSDDEEQDEITVPPVTNGTSTAKDPSKVLEKEAQRQRMRAALGLPIEPVAAAVKSKKSEAPVGDMQVTFTPALSSGPKRESVFENEPIKDETTVEKYIRKEKERKAKRKAKAKAARGEAPDEDPAESHAGPEDTEAQRHRTNGNDAHIADAQKHKYDKPRKDKDETEQDDGDDPFADPFFTDPVSANKTSRSLARAQKRADRLALEASSAAQRAELELLMADDQSGPPNVRHFDMKEIMKMEKEARRKARKGKIAKKLKTATADGVREDGVGDEAKGDGGGQSFKLNVQDPRFAQVFESHEFAIDPTNPRFKGTEGMNALLEEGRRRRTGKRRDRDRDEDDADGGERKAKKSKVDRARSMEEGSGDDLQSLVAKVKGKTSKIRA